jgi:LmbE family N-acetylglucosaminyl deacetylase
MKSLAEPAAVKRRRRTRGGILRGLLAAAVLVALALVAALGRSPAPLHTAEFLAPQVTFDPSDRVLVLAPHPDDETLGTGGVIQQALDAGLPVHVVFLTNGDANEWSFVLYNRRPELLQRQVEAMGEVRHNEAVAATGVLGLKPEQLTFLGYPDFGTLRIWLSHWGSEPAFRSLLTRVTKVPYADAYRPGAAYKGEEVLADLKAVIEEFKPTKIFVSHPADYNTDHEALYLFTRVAMWDLGLQPEVYPYLVHAPAWPMPRGADPGRTLAPPADLAPQESWWTLPITSQEIGRKQAALEQHRTQYQSNERYLSSFIRANELFGDYPDASLPPGAGEAGPDAILPDTRAPEPAEGLTEEERAKFVGVEWRKIERDGDNLVLTAALSKPLAEGMGLSAYLFGYRPDKAFGDMPKIHLSVGALSQAVSDQSRRLEDSGVVVTRNARDIVLHVPLALLGDPDRAFVSARTYLGDMPLDSSAWRVLDLRAEQQ